MKKIEIIECIASKVSCNILNGKTFYGGKIPFYVVIKFNDSLERSVAKAMFERHNFKVLGTGHTNSISINL